MLDSQLLLFGSGLQANYWMTSACRRTSFILLFLSVLLNPIFDWEFLWSAEFCHCRTFTYLARIWTPRIRTSVYYANLQALWFCPSLSKRLLIVQDLVSGCILSLRNRYINIDELLTSSNRICLWIVIYFGTIGSPVSHWTWTFLWTILVALSRTWRRPAIVTFFSFTIFERALIFLHWLL